MTSLTGKASYGLGWIVGEYHGLQLLCHGGNTLGFTSEFAFLPDVGVGVLVLTNAQSTNLFNDVVRERLFELVFEQPSQADAAPRLASVRGLRWVIGGACSGKSSECQTISSWAGVPVYDMDEHVYGRYLGRYSATRHPASSAWFRRPDGLAWVLSLPWEAFDDLNRATNAEFLDLVATDIVERCRWPCHPPHWWSVGSPLMAS